MPAQTDLSGSPHFDDFDETKNFHKVLFVPGVSVQTRELNQLQTILQNQIERFGDNIYKQGTVIDGCNFSFHNSVPYVKIKDIETDGSRVIISDYKNYYAKNSSNLTCKIVDTAVGYETTENKNTLFVDYLNSGTNLNTFSFSSDDVLTIYNPLGSVENIKINDGSVGFSNNDEVVILSAIAVTNSTGGVTFSNTFSVGDIITNTVVANAQIVEVDTTTSPSSVILRIKPLAVDLVNASANSNMWTFTVDDDFSANSGSTGIVSEIFGSSANASLVTSGTGSITNITVEDIGSGYTVNPTVSVRSYTATTGQIANLDLEEQTYIARVTVMPASAVPIGTGYGVSVDQGIVYQKGFFIRVDPQFIIVSRYTSPDDIVVGFRTDEEIINANIDESLFDNVLGSTNSIAPGASRLKLTTSLVALAKSKAEADTEFLSIIEFSNGLPYQQKKQTQYNVINDELARRMYEADGNFVLDEFRLNTTSKTIFEDEANSFIAVIDPGTAYINGYRVATDAAYNLSVDKGTETATSSVTASLNYGSYIKIKEVGGAFKFNTGDLITLYDGAKQYLSLTPGQAITAPSSNILGYARIRSFTHDSGVPGTNSAIYRLYLFDIQIASGKNFANVRSVFYNGTYKAVGDIVTVTDPSTSSTICKLYDSQLSALAFKNGVSATKSINAESYVYRTVNQSLTANQSGYIVFNTGVDEVFPYPSGSLSTSQERDFVVTPLANGVASANLSGSIQVYSTNTSVVGTSTTFGTQLVAGDYIKVANATVNTIVQIASVANNTYATLTANASANITSNAALYFPQFVPLSLEESSRTATISASANQATLYVGTALAADMAVSVAYNIKTSAAQVDKTVHRDSYVRLKLSNNSSNTVGPWALGVTDVFRLKNVYVANGASNTLSINAVSSVNSSADFVLYSDHRFSNGDSVTYVGGTYNIPGLANNTLYYVYGANTTGFQLSSDNTTPLAINAIATNDISHTFSGNPLFFGSSTTGVEEITNDFYIDHNQNENYYNTSYLYLKPGATALSNNDVLLVKFDVFTHSADAGMKHIESYNIDDTVALANSSTTINTLEIPQFYSTQDTYYDLRDCIDVRPHVVASANVSANTLVTYSINPTEPDANSKFSSTDKKFPAPESSFAGDVEYYQSRIDRIIVDKNGNFSAIKGEAGTNKIALEPANSLTINVLKIPPYPSFPLALSSETVKFADTKIANEKYLFKRLQDFKIQTQFTSADIMFEQPKVYRMSDIGSIERRVADLEYYQALTLAEVQVKNLVIPSNIDATLDRFKYGFFVDAFSDTSYSDLNHPEFSAAIVEGCLVPNYNELNLEFKFNTANSEVSALTRGSKILSSSFNEYTLINQSVATDGAVTSTNTTPVTVQKLVNVDIINKSSEYSISGDVYEDWTFTFSNTAYSPVELYMNCTDNDTAIVVYQSTTPTYQSETITTTSQYASPNLLGTNYVLPGGKAYLVGNRSRWENDTGFRSGGPAAAGGLWIEDSYRMTWNHDPLKGIYYKIRVYKGSHIITPDRDAPRGSYAYRLYYPVDSDVNTSNAAPTATRFQYVGTARLEKPVESIHRTRIGHGHYKNYTDIIPNILDYNLSVHGLKPNTLHRIYINDVDVTNSCIIANVNGNTQITPWVPTFTSTSGGIPSDGQGKIDVVLFNSTIEPGTSQFTLNNKDIFNSVTPGNKIKVVSTDAASANVVISNNATSSAETSLMTYNYTVPKGSGPSNVIGDTSAGIGQDSSGTAWNALTRQVINPPVYSVQLYNPDGTLKT